MSSIVIRLIQQNKRSNIHSIPIYATCFGRNMLRIWDISECQDIYTAVLVG